jgi:hypothetical protein
MVELLPQRRDVIEFRLMLLANQFQGAPVVVQLGLGRFEVGLPFANLLFLPREFFPLLADLYDQYRLELAETLALRSEEFLRPLALLAERAGEFVAPGISNGWWWGSCFGRHYQERSAEG